MAGSDSRITKPNQAQDDGEEAPKNDRCDPHERRIAGPDPGAAQKGASEEAYENGLDSDEPTDSSEESAHRVSQD